MDQNYLFKNDNQFYKQIQIDNIGEFDKFRVDQRDDYFYYVV